MITAIVLAALLFAVLSFVFPDRPVLLRVAVVLLCAALLIPTVIR